METVADTRPVIVVRTSLFCSACIYITQIFFLLSSIVPLSSHTKCINSSERYSIVFMLQDIEE